MKKEDKSQIDFEGETTLGNEFENDETTFIDAKEEEVYPYENINIGKDNLSAFQLYRKYNNGIIKLDPDFQREGNVWSPKQKSELIESILIGIPLPILYIKENKSGQWFIIDGRQRLSTIFDFIDGKFNLSHLTILKHLNGFKFKRENEESDFQTLSITEKGKIEDVNLTLHIIKEPTPEKLTYDLFDRVNRGGTRLNNQEMRNAIYQGSSTIFLKALSKLNSFKVATSNISSNRMKDRYLILRFVAFYLWRKNALLDVESNGLVIEYKSDLEDFLSKSMRFLNLLEFETYIDNYDNLSYDVYQEILVTKDENQNILKKSSQIYLNILKKFDQAMINIYDSFEDNSFRLPKKDGGVKRPINMALFEVATYFFIELGDLYENHKDFIRDEYYKLINNDEFIRFNENDEDKDFVKSLTYIVDSNKSVNRRFGIIESKIKFIRKYVG